MKNYKSYFVYKAKLRGRLFYHLSTATHFGDISTFLKAKLNVSLFINKQNDNYVGCQSCLTFP